MEFTKKVQQAWNEIITRIKWNHKMHDSPFVLSERMYLTQAQREVVYRKIDELQQVIEEMELKEAMEKEQKEAKEREKAEKKARKLEAKMARKQRRDKK